jgi:hypothetical protein
MSIVPNPSTRVMNSGQTPIERNEADLTNAALYGRRGVLIFTDKGRDRTTEQKLLG